MIDICRNPQIIVNRTGLVDDPECAVLREVMMGFDDSRRRIGCVAKTIPSDGNCGISVTFALWI